MRYGVCKNSLMEPFLSLITMYIYSFIHTRLTNDLGYGQLSNPNRLLKLVLMYVEIIGNSFSDISTSLVNDFITSYSLSESPQIARADDPILITQSSLWTSCRIEHMTF